MSRARDRSTVRHHARLRSPDFRRSRNRIRENILRRWGYSLNKGSGLRQHEWHRGAATDVALHPLFGGVKASSWLRRIFWEARRSTEARRANASEQDSRATA